MEEISELMALSKQNHKDAGIKMSSSKSQKSAQDHSLFFRGSVVTPDAEAHETIAFTFKILTVRAVNKSKRMLVCFLFLKTKGLTKQFQATEKEMEFYMRLH